MKRIIPETTQLLALLAIGCGFCHLLPAKAQENANPFSAAASSSETNAVLSNAAPAVLEDTSETDKWKSEINREALVVFGRDAELKTNESAEAVVVIGGSAKVSGKVREAVVVIGGDAEIDGEVGNAVVAVLGSVKINPGAVIHNDVTSVGGRVDVAKGAHIHGTTQEVDLGGLRLGKIPQGLKDWLVHCVLKFRPLAPQVGWVWFIAIAFFLVYLLITLALPRPVTVCVDEITRRPMTTFFIGLLAKLLVPLVMLLLIVTGIGIVVVPFILAALIAGALIGKAALMQYLGRQLGRQVGSDALQKPLVAFLLGWILITLIYMVPILSLLVFGLTSIWGIGVAITATFAGLRRESPRRPPPPASTMAASISPATAAPMATTVSPATDPRSPIPPSADSAQPAAVPLLPPTTPAPAGPPVALSFPIASFWERMGAGFLDLVLVTILSAMVPMAPFWPLIALAYFSGMWAWKGTTVGGVVLKLQVVRQANGGTLTFVVALVRALAAAFSIFVLFLGFFWIAWDRDKQGWHDKIAGTLVVRLPRALPLVCV
jgi:uncharacterized RDD family membrane protein YckC/cytoskeletal protein CcmA (bactofilin family)